jgi:ferredoxin
MDMKVQIDKDLCVGDKTCVAICPELFAMEGDVAKTKIKKVPESLIGLCWDAAESCPAEAIIIEK